MKKTVNALGDICPIPLVKAKEAIKELQGAGTVEVLVVIRCCAEPDQDGKPERLWL